jgi:hypothetical protein
MHLSRDCYDSLLKGSVDGTGIVVVVVVILRTTQLVDFVHRQVFQKLKEERNHLLRWAH